MYGYLVGYRRCHSWLAGEGGRDWENAERRSAILITFDQPWLVDQH